MTPYLPTAPSVIRALVALDVEGNHITEAQGEEVARLFEGDFSLFQELDESPGRFLSPYYHGGEGYTYDTWHWKLRQARNNTRRFFDILNEGRS